MFAFLSSYIFPVDPEMTSVSLKLAPPSVNHWFGCDDLGRDVFSRVLSGTRKTLSISITVNILALLIGGLIGSLSGYFGRWTDVLLTQFSDAFMAIPGILLALMLLSVGGRGIAMLILTLGIVFFPSYSRIFRNHIRVIKEQDFVLQARLLQISTPRLLLVHILPALIPQLLPSIVLGLGNAAVAEASLSYLGLGVQPPDASWGKMLAEGQSYIFVAPWMVVFPSAFLIIYILGLYFISEEVRMIRRNH